MSVKFQLRKAFGLAGKSTNVNSHDPPWKSEGGPRTSGPRLLNQPHPPFTSLLANRMTRVFYAFRPLANRKPTFMAAFGLPWYCAFFPPRYYFNTTWKVCLKQWKSNLSHKVLVRQNNELSRFCLTMMSDIVLFSERPVDSKFSEKSEVMPILARRSYCGVWSLAAPTCQDPPGLERPSSDPFSTSWQPHVCLISSQLPLRLAHIALLTGLTLTSFTQSQAILPPPSIQQPWVPSIPPSLSPTRFPLVFLLPRTPPAAMFHPRPKPSFCRPHPKAAGPLAGSFDGNTKGILIISVGPDQHLWTSPCGPALRTSPVDQPLWISPWGPELQRTCLGSRTIEN